MRRWGRILLGVVVVLVVLWVIFSLGGGYDTASRERVEGPGPPSWTKACLHAKGAWKTCARVHGRVIVALRRNGDKGSDRHLVVDSGFRPRAIVLKTSGRSVHVPGPGSSITAVGTVGKGGSGHDVVTVKNLGD
jgi:hypothetical protein